MTSQETAVSVEAVKPLLVEALLKRLAARQGDASAADGSVLTEGDVTMLLAEVNEEIVVPAIAELLESMPEAASLPPERLNALIAEALAEVIAEAVG